MSRTKRVAEYLIASLRARAPLHATKVKILRIAQFPQVNLREKLNFEEIALELLIYVTSFYLQNLTVS